RQAKNRMHEIVRELASGYPAQGTEKRDQLSHLSNQVLDKISEEVVCGRKSAEWADGELVILYAAGHEPTPMGITWMCYILSTRPELQDQLYEESKPLALDDLNNSATWERLALHQQVVDESLRYFPPVPGFGRSYEHDLELSQTCVPKGATIAV